MQPLTAAPRDAFTAAQVTALLVAPDLEVDFGVEVLLGAWDLVDGESSSFEGGTTGLWGNGFYGGAYCTIASSSAHAAVGVKSMLITWPATTAQNSGAQWAIGLTVGAQYTFSVQVFVPAGSPRVTLVEIFGGSPSDTSSVNDQWQQLSITFIAIKVPYFFSVINDTASTSGQQCYVDDWHGTVGDALFAPGGVLDISADVSAGTVHRDNLANVHGTLDLTVSRQLAWGYDRVRPYMLLSSPSVGLSDVRFNQGVFLLMTPDQSLDESPTTFTVTGYDQLHILQNPVGDSRSVAAGANVLTAVRAALTAAGIVAPVLLDSSGSAKTLATAMVWPATSSDASTWLLIVNKLLAAIGYRGIWADWDGNLRSGPYVLPADRPSEFDLNVGDLDTGIVADARSVSNDVWGVPNWFRYIRNDMLTTPIEGAGRVTIQNLATGPSSQASVGRIVRAPVVYLDAVSHADLVVQANRLYSLNTRVAEVITTKLGPMPALWHVDRLTYADPALGASREVQVRSWSLPLSGQDMDVVMESVS